MLHNYYITFWNQIVQHHVLLEGDALLFHLCSRYRTGVAFFLAPTLPASTANVQSARNSQRAIAVPSLGQCEDATSRHYMLIAFSIVEPVASSMIPIIMPVSRFSSSKFCFCTLGKPNTTKPLHLRYIVLVLSVHVALQPR